VLPINHSTNQLWLTDRNHSIWQQTVENMVFIVQNVTEQRQTRQAVLYWR